MFKMVSRLLDTLIFHQDLLDRPQLFMLTTFPNSCNKFCARMELLPPTWRTRLPEVPSSPTRVNSFSQTPTHQCLMLHQRRQLFKKKIRDLKIYIKRLFINPLSSLVCLDLLQDSVSCAQQTQHSTLCSLLSHSPLLPVTRVFGELSQPFIPHLCPSQTPFPVLPQSVVSSFQAVE